MDRALDNLYDTVDDLLLAEKFEECDRILRDVDVRTSDVHMLLGYLTITLAAHSKLPYRAAFYEQVRQELTIRGHPHTICDGLAAPQAKP
jgi:hypothetical protein